MTDYHLTLPIGEEEVRKFRIGDSLYVTGVVVSARDAAHRKALEIISKGDRLPVDLSGLAIYHLGPVVKKIDGEWKVLAAGPTTSTRLETYEHEFIEKTNVRVIIGKGGMGPKTVEGCEKYGAVYTIYTGGAAALAAKSIKKVRDVHWLELGIPEAMWVLEVEEFGPLIVTIDSHGRNFYDEVYNQVKRKVKEEIYPRLGIVN